MVDVATTELTWDEETGVSGEGDGVSITELDADSSIVVDVGSGDGMNSGDVEGDGDGLITGVAVKEIFSDSLITVWRSVIDGVGVVVGSTDVSSTVDDATEVTVSTSVEATSDIASGVVAVLESSEIGVGDSERLADAL